MNSVRWGCLHGLSATANARGIARRQNANPFTMPFILRLTIALLLAAAAAALIAPFAAFALAAAGYRFPFPRIFDRTVMVTMAVMMMLVGAPTGSRPAPAARLRAPAG